MSRVSHVDGVQRIRIQIHSNRLAFTTMKTYRVKNDATNILLYATLSSLRLELNSDKKQHFFMAKAAFFQHIFSISSVVIASNMKRGIYKQISEKKI